MSQYSKQPEPRLCKNGCGQEIVWDNANRYFLNVANNERHMCPNFTPRQRSQDIRQTQGYVVKPPFTQQFPTQKSAKEESMQAMHDENTELTKAYHKILEKQNELKERELDLIERQVKTQEWMSQTVQQEQEKDKKQNEAVQRKT